MDYLPTFDNLPGVSWNLSSGRCRLFIPYAGVKIAKL